MRKFIWEGREIGLPCWLSQFSKTKLRQPIGQTIFSTFPKDFPIYFKPKVAIAKFIGKIQKRVGIIKSGLDALPLFLLDNLLNQGLPVQIGAIITTKKERTRSNTTRTQE